MSYRYTVNAITVATNENASDFERHVAAATLEVSPRAEKQRENLTPAMIARSHTAHVEDLADTLRVALDAYEDPEAEYTPTDTELVSFARALLAAIGERG